MLGAIDGSDLTATAMVGQDGPRWWAYYLAVAPSKRRCGLGRRMMQEAEDWLRARRPVKLNVMILRSNAPTIEFHWRRGYEDAAGTVLGRGLVDAS